MKIKFKIILPFFISSLLLASCNNIGTNFYSEVKVSAEGSTIIVKNPTIDASLKDGVEKAILPQEWMNYYNDLQQSHNYLNISKYYTVGVENTTPVDILLNWTNSENGCYYYTLHLSTNFDMSNAKVFFTQDPTCTLTGLFAGMHYYYQIHAIYAEYTTISRKFDFKTVDFIRLMNIESVQNCRDIGNKYTSDHSKRIKQGIMYRSASLNGVTEKGKLKAINELGIKTDLDLREPQAVAASPLGDKVKYISNAVSGYGSPYYIGGGTGIDTPAYQPACRDNIKAFANKDNYPLIFHCTVGRDRTGTLAILLQLLCGISIEDIKVDYIVYGFCSLVNDNPTGSMEPVMENIFTYLEYYIGNDGIAAGDIYERTEEYCRDIGVTQSEIESIRNIVLEEVPANE